MTGGLYVNKREGWVRKLMGENGEEDRYIIIVIGSVLPVFMHLQQQQCAFIPQC